MMLRRLHYALVVGAVLLLALLTQAAPTGRRVECSSHNEVVSVIEPSCHSRGLHGQSSVCSGPVSEAMPSFCKASSRTFELGVLNLRLNAGGKLALHRLVPGSPELVPIESGLAVDQFGDSLEVWCQESPSVSATGTVASPPETVRFRALPSAPSTVPPPTGALVGSSGASTGAGDDVGLPLPKEALARLTHTQRSCASGLCCLGTPDWHGGAVFILPNASPHNESTLARHLHIAGSISSPQQQQSTQEDDNNVLSIALVLSVSTLNHTSKFLSPASLSTCTLVHVPPSRQVTFPPVRIVAGTSKQTASSSPSALPPSSVGGGKLRPLPSLSRCTPRNPTFSPPSQEQDVLDEHTLFVASHPSLAEGLSPAAVAVGSARRQNKNGADADEEADEDLEGGELGPATGVMGAVSFLQVETFHKFVAAGVKAVMNPILHIVQDITGMGITNSMSTQIRNAVLDRAPKQIIFLTRDPIRRNVTNQVVDATSMVLTRVLQRSVPIALTPYISDHVTRWTPPIVLQRLEPILESALGYDLIHIIPPILQRSLPLSLTYSLNRAITHAVVPSVASALSRSTAAGHYCFLCYYHKRACFLCNASPESQYYLAYHSTYFADYFSDYYTPYYYGAINKVVNRNNPDVLPEHRTGFADTKGNIWPAEE